MPTKNRLPKDYFENAMPKVYAGEAVLDMPEPDWLLPDFIQQGGLTIIFGVPGSGKSLIMMDWANVLGAPDSGRSQWAWMGRKRKGTNQVLYVMGEGQGGLSGRLQAWKKHRNVRLLPRNVEWMMEPMAIWRPADQQDLTLIQQDLVHYIKGRGVKVVFFDTLAATFGGGNENSQQDMNQYLSMCQAIMQLGCAVVIAHHSTKGTGDMRGSTVLKGAADTVIKMKPEFDKDTHALLHTTLYANKQKDGIPFRSITLLPKTYKVDTFVGQSLVLIWDDEPKLDDDRPLGVRIVAFVGTQDEPVTGTEIRAAVKGRNVTTSNMLVTLVGSGALMMALKDGKFSIPKAEVIGNTED